MYWLKGADALWLGGQIHAWQKETAAYCQVYGELPAG